MTARDGDTGDTGDTGDMGARESNTGSNGGGDLRLDLGPLALRAVAMSQQGQPFDHGKEPNWRDETPHELCRASRADYPEPRTCSAFIGETRCHLGHPANCRWLVDSAIDSEIKRQGRRDR